MMRFSSALIGLLACVLIGCGSQADSGQRSERVIFFAAASTKEATEQVARDFQDQSGTTAEVVLGPSSGLARQIEQGASADLFLSADQASADYLAAKQLVSERRYFLTNRLVVVVPANSKIQVKTLHDLADARIRKLALAEPKVPAGEYARQALQKSGIWDQVKDRVVGGIDVRATLTFVARGEAEAGLVYATDARDLKAVRVALDVPPELHQPIRYPLVLLKRASIKTTARRFYDYLSSSPAIEVFERAGFGVAR